MSEGTAHPTDEEIRLAEQEVELAARRTLDALQRWLLADNATLSHAQAWLESARRQESDARARLDQLRAARVKAGGRA